MTNALNAILVDSNILVYAYDPRDRRKQELAVLVIDRLIEAGMAVLSVQCLSEFFNATTRKLPERLSPAEALERVTRLARSCRILDLTPAAVLEGCRAATQYKLSVWDALIWATAKLNQVPYVLTEDLQHGLFLEGVRLQNPFEPNFDAALLEPAG
jgi:predicted nucleic acid-binding protein